MVSVYVCLQAEQKCDPPVPTLSYTAPEVKDNNERTRLFLMHHIK